MIAWPDRKYAGRAIERASVWPRGVRAARGAAMAIAMAMAVVAMAVVVGADLAQASSVHRVEDAFSALLSSNDVQTNRSMEIVLEVKNRKRGCCRAGR